MMVFDALRHATLEDLNREIFDKTGARFAAIVLAQPWARLVSAVWNMNRNAWSSPTDPDAFEDLLGYWSILEVARMAFVVPDRAGGSSDAFIWCHRPTSWVGALAA